MLGVVFCAVKVQLGFLYFSPSSTRMRVYLVEILRMSREVVVFRGHGPPFVMSAADKRVCIEIDSSFRRLRLAIEFDSTRSLKRLPCKGEWYGRIDVHSWKLLSVWDNLCRTGCPAIQRFFNGCKYLVLQRAYINGRHGNECRSFPWS